VQPDTLAAHRAVHREIDDLGLGHGGRILTQPGQQARRSQDGTT
jgi:hypothetical protein